MNLFRGSFEDWLLPMRPSDEWKTKIKTVDPLLYHGTTGVARAEDKGLSRAWRGLGVDEMADFHAKDANSSSGVGHRALAGLGYLAGAAGGLWGAGAAGGGGAAGSAGASSAASGASSAGGMNWQALARGMGGMGNSMKNQAASNAQEQQRRNQLLAEMLRAEEQQQDMPGWAGGGYR